MENTITVAVNEHFVGTLPEEHYGTMVMQVFAECYVS